MSNEVEVIAPKVTLELDAKLTIGDLTDLAVGEQEERLLMERETTDTALSAAKAAHTKSEQVLKDLADAVVKKMKADKPALELAAALNKFHGTKKRFTADVPDDKVSLDASKKIVIGTIQVLDSEKNSYSYGHSIFEKKTETAFTEKMQAALKDIAVKAKAVKAATDELTKIRRMLTDLPRLQRRAKNEIVKAQLRGELGTGQDILDTVMGAQPKALPYHGE